MLKFKNKKIDLNIKLQKKSFRQLVKLLDTIEEINKECGNGCAITAADRCLMYIKKQREDSIEESKENGTYRIWFDNPD